MSESSTSSLNTSQPISGLMEEAQSHVLLSESQTKELLSKRLLSHPEQIYLVIGLPSDSWLFQVVSQTQGRLIVWEPDASILEKALSNPDNAIKSALEKRLQLCQDLSEALALLRQWVNLPNRLDCLLPPENQAQRLLAYEPDFEATIDRVRQDKENEFSSANSFHEIWMHNLARNLPQLATSHPIQSLTDSAAGKAAFVISRGPSLDAALPALKELSSSAVLIAVGGALRSLERAGIVPDFALFYDARGMKEQLHGLSLDYLSQIRFVHSPCSESAAFEAPSIQRYHFWTPYHSIMASWFEKIVGQPQPVLARGGGTVSLIALHLASILGCAEITLVGQDLAFPNNQAYAGGQQVVTDEAGMLNLPASDILITRPMPMTTVRGQRGEELPTLQAYAGFIRQFESVAQGLGEEHQLFNASVGGAQINGFTWRSITDCLTSPHPTETNWKNGHWKKVEAGLHSNSNAITSAMTAFLTLCKQMDDGLRLCHTLKKSLGNHRHMNPQEVTKVLMKIQVWLDDPSHSFFQFLCVYPTLFFRQPDQASIPVSQRGKRLVIEIETLLLSAKEQLNPKP